LEIEKGDLALALFNHNGTSSDEISFHKNEYIIVINWNVGDGYAFGYNTNNPKKKGKFPSPLVRKYSENNSLFYFFFNYIRIAFISFKIYINIYIYFNKNLILIINN